MKFDLSNLEVNGLWKAIRVPVYAFLALILVHGILFHMFTFSVEPGTASALAFGGNVSQKVYYPGLHTRMPWYHTIPMKIWTVADPRQTAPTDSNNQSIGATVAPQIWIDPEQIPALANNYGSFDSLMNTVVDPQINQATRAKTSLYTPEELIFGRPKLVADIGDTLQKSISEQLSAKGVSPTAVRVGLVAVEHFNFNDQVRTTLEQKAESGVKARTAKAQAQIREITADQNGQVTELRADANAKVTQLLADADAYKAKKLGEAAAANSSVSRFEAIQSWVKAGGHVSNTQLGSGTQVIVNQPAPQSK